MTELELGMAALGGAVVVGVFGYNKWQESRHKKLAEKVMNPRHDDVLLGTGEAVATKAPLRAEPGLGGAVASEASRLEPGLSDHDSVAVRTPQPPLSETLSAEGGELPVALSAETPTAEADPQAPVGQPQIAASADVPSEYLPPALLDTRQEFVVAMALVEAALPQQLFNSQRDILQRLSKPVHWMGFNEKTREWERLNADSEQPVRHLRVGLQLVNRLGPVSDADIAMFVGAMQALADELMAVINMPSPRVQDMAAELDRFCAEVDLEIGVNLVSRGVPFPGTKIRALAESAGMVLGSQGLFTRYDEDGRVQFSLQNYETTPFAPDTIRTMTTHGLTFLLDVPRVVNGERVFMQMTDIAKRFAEALQGALVDDNRVPLGEPQLEHIRREFVGKPQATMQAFGLAPGSPQALRLFS